MNVTQNDILSIVENAGISAPVSKINGATPLREAGVDSLEMMNILLAIEEKFGIKIPDDEIDRLGTVDSIVNYLRGR